MNKRTARRLAAATALVAPGAVGIHVTAHAAPTILTPSPNSAIGGRSVTIFARYNAPRPVASAKLFLDNLLIATRNFQPAGLSGTVNLTWDSTAAIPGAHRITIKMYDRAGSLVAQESVPVSIVNGTAAEDTVPPQIAILTPSGEKPVQGAFDIKVLASDNSGKDPYVSVFVDQELRGVSNKQPYTFSINSTEYANGAHSVEAWAYDVARNKTTANAVTVHVNNPGGATALNEDVNRLGETAVDVDALEPSSATSPALPDVAAPQPLSATFPVEAPALAAIAPQPTKMPAQKPIAKVAVKPTTATRTSKVAAVKPAPAKPAPAKPAAPAKPTPAKPRLVAAPPPSTERRNAMPRLSLGAQSSVPLVHIPPVPQVKVVSRPEPEPMEAPVEPVVARGGIQELPTEVSPVEVAPVSGIQELPVDAVESAAPLEVAEPAPVTEHEVEPVTAPVVPEPVVIPAPKPVPAKTRIAKALPEISRPTAASKPVVKPVAKPAPKPVVPKAAEKVVEPIVEPVVEPLVETVAAAPAPIVLTMRGERVVEEASSPAPVAKPAPQPAPKPAPKRTMVVRADAPKPVAPVKIASPAKPATGNAAPRPARLTALPQPTAPAVRSVRPAHSTRIAANTPPARRVVDLRPEIIRELPADRVASGQIRHAVRPGETVNNLARAYGVPVKRLLAANHLGRRHDLRIGQELAIPAPFRVAFNNETVQFDVAPRIENGVTLAALRHIYQQAGGTLTWNPARREVRATGAGANIIVRIGSSEALVNGRRVRLSAPASLDEGRTFLPVEFIGQSLGLRAEFDLRSGSINLRSTQVDADIRKPA